MQAQTTERPHPRYVLSSVTGWPIVPGSTSGAHSTTSWAVLDRWVNHREIESHVPGLGSKSAHCEARARAACDRLNDDHDAWLAARST